MGKRLDAGVALPTSRMPKWSAPLIAIAVLAVAGWALHRQLTGLDWAAVGTALQSLGWKQLVPAALLLAVSFFAYGLLERLASAHVGKPLPLPRACAAALATQGISLSTGKGLLVAGLVRLRLFGRWGFTPGESLGVTALVFLHGNVGLAVLLGAACLWARAWDWAVWAGIAGIGGALAWLVVCHRGKPFEVFNRQVVPPTVREQLIGATVGAVEKLACMLLAWVLMPGDPGIPFATFAALMLVSFVIARASQVPGGIGVLEATALGLWPGVPPKETVIAGLLAFRVAYYLVPLIPGLLILAWAGYLRRVAPCATASA